MGRRTDGRAINRTVAAYVDWKAESIAVQDAYRLWAGARRDDARAAHLAYAAALDREAQASDAYAEIVRSTAPNGAGAAAACPC
jgi:hypothetical protein